MVMTQLFSNFGRICFGLLAGIGGGIPDEDYEDYELNGIHLGDVVVSHSRGSSGVTWAPMACARSRSTWTTCTTRTRRRPNATSTPNPWVFSPPYVIQNLIRRTSPNHGIYPFLQGRPLLIFHLFQCPKVRVAKARILRSL